MDDVFDFLAFILLIYIIVTSIVQWIKNENSPVRAIPATIVDMQRKTNYRSHSYHITFEREDGYQIELKVSRYEYNDFDVGDKGILCFQGTRFQGFVRK